MLHYATALAAFALLPPPAFAGRDGPPETAERNILGLRAAPFSEPMETDRPDFTEGTRTVARGRFQLEGGYTYTRDREGGETSTSHTAPELLLRIGIVESLELRLAWEGVNWARPEQDGGSESGRGITDAGIGAKLRLLDQSGLTPDFSLLGELSIPLGDDERSAEQVDPGIKLLWAYDLAERVGLAGNLNFAAVSNGQRTRYLQTAASVSLSFDAADWLGAYVEYVGVFPSDPALDDEHYLSPGLTFPLGPNVQLDVRVGFGLNQEAADLFAGAGFAFRW